MANSKKCTKCLSTKSVYEFHTVNSRLTAKCKSCRNEENKIWRNNNPEKDRLRKKKWQEKNPDYCINKYRQNKDKYKQRMAIPEFKERHNRSAKAWRARNPEKYKAQRMVGHAITAGKLKRGPCTNCSNPKSEGHHKDYSKPLEVIWLCRQCHYNEHKAMKK